MCESNNNNNNNNKNQYDIGVKNLKNNNTFVEHHSTVASEAAQAQPQ